MYLICSLLNTKPSLCVINTYLLLFFKDLVEHVIIHAAGYIETETAQLQHLKREEHKQYWLKKWCILYVFMYTHIQHRSLEDITDIWIWWERWNAVLKSHCHYILVTTVYLGGSSKLGLWCSSASKMTCVACQGPSETAVPAAGPDPVRTAVLWQWPAYSHGRCGKKGHDLVFPLCLVLLSWMFSQSYFQENIWETRTKINGEMTLQEVPAVPRWQFHCQWSTH